MNAFCLTLLLLAGFGAARAQRLVTQTAALSAGQRVALELKYAHRIRVRPGTGPGLTVRAQVTIADAALAKTYDLTVATSATEVRIMEKLDQELLARAWKHNWPDGHHSDDDKDDQVLRLDYEVTLPAATALHLETISGDIEAENLAGAVMLKSIGGDLQLTGLSGAVHARAISGDIHFTKLPGRASVDAESISGDVDVSWPLARKAELLLKSMSGEVYADPAITFSGPKTRSYEGYELRGQVAGGSGPLVSLHTISGNVFFRRQP